MSYFFERANAQKVRNPMMHIAAKSICAKVDEYARLKIQIEELNSKA